MIHINKARILKLLPIIAIVGIIVVVLGLIFGKSYLQIILSIAISLVLISSGLLFQSVGRNRDRDRDKGTMDNPSNNNDP